MVSYRAIKRCKIVIVLLAAADGGVVAMVLGNVFYVAVGGVCLLLLVGAVAVGYCRCRWSSHKRPTPPVARWTTHIRKRFNPLEIRGNYSATSNNMRMVHWPFVGGLLHLAQRGGDWAGPQPAQLPPRCTKCNSPPINGQCTSHRIAV